MKQFKPYDKVLVRIGNKTWQARFFSHRGEGRRYVLTSGAIVIGDKDILPFEGNEHLTGTTNEPEEEIILKKGESIVCSNNIISLVNGTGFITHFHTIRDFRIEVEGGNYWDYCIPLSQFKEKNTKHGIICVRNGKLVRYE